MDIYKQFDSDMRDIYFKAKKEVKYNATRFIQMVTDIGSYETAKKLISHLEPSDDFTNLYMAGRLDLTVEALIVSSKYQSLFSKEEIKRCKERLGPDYLKFNNII
jgi:hypothetical protein